ncbi:MAG: response regulator [Gammaproteobacteria bacterium]|nr:response regulator [Gammaproteobacteria bacterium]
MKTALVIEDNANNMELITFILERHGFQTHRATQGMDGVESFMTTTPDLVLLDIQLPDIDGIEVLRILRSLEGTPNTPIIAVSSYALSGEHRRLIEAGCSGYIEKPIDPSTFMGKINGVVNNLATT